MGLVLNRVYEPLSCSLSMDVRGTGLVQSYVVDSGVSVPDRRISPTVITPVVGLIDRSMVLSDGRANGLLADFKWFADGQEISGSDAFYRIDNSGGDNRGRLLVVKNVGADSVVLRFEGNVVDVVAGAVRRSAFVSGEVVLSTVVERGEKVVLSGGYPNGFSYNPLKEQGLDFLSLFASLRRGIVPVPCAYWWYDRGDGMVEGDGRLIGSELTGSKADLLRVPVSYVGKERKFRVVVQDCTRELLAKQSEVFKDKGRNYVLGARSLSFDTHENTLWVGHTFELSADFMRDLNRLKRKVFTISAEVDFDIVPANDDCHFGIDVKVTQSDGAVTWGWFNRKNDNGIFKGVDGDGHFRMVGRRSITMDLGSVSVVGLENLRFFTAHCNVIDKCRIWDVKFELGDSDTGYRPSDEELSDTDFLADGVSLGAGFRPVERDEGRCYRFDYTLGRVLSKYRTRIMTSYGGEDSMVAIPHNRSVIPAWVEVDSVAGTVAHPERSLSVEWSDGVRGFRRLIDMNGLTGALSCRVFEDLSKGCYATLGNGDKFVKSGISVGDAQLGAGYVFVDFVCGTVQEVFSMGNFCIYVNSERDNKIVFIARDGFYHYYTNPKSNPVMNDLSTGRICRIEVRGTDVTLNGVPLVLRVESEGTPNGNPKYNSVHLGRWSTHKVIRVGVKIDADSVDFDHYWDLSGGDADADVLLDKGVGSRKFNLRKIDDAPVKTPNKPQFGLI